MKKYTLRNTLKLVQPPPPSPPPALIWFVLDFVFLKENQTYILTDRSQRDRLKKSVQHRLPPRFFQLKLNVQEGVMGRGTGCSEGGTTRVSPHDRNECTERPCTSLANSTPSPFETYSQQTIPQQTVEREYGRCARVYVLHPSQTRSIAHNRTEQATRRPKSK